MSEIVFPFPHLQGVLGAKGVALHGRALLRLGYPWCTFLEEVAVEYLGTVSSGSHLSFKVCFKEGPCLLDMILAELLRDVPFRELPKYLSEVDGLCYAFIKWRLLMG
jgi:hypothetical protein